MKKNNNVSYTEVSFDGYAMDRTYRNPLTIVYQYEYALYFAISRLFHSVRNRSLCIGSLMLYFCELPRKTKEENKDPKEITKRTQIKVLEEMETLVARDVVGNIVFPKMNICAAEVITAAEDDGTHSFIFTDGVYGFSVHLDMPRKGHPKGIKVKNTRPFIF